MSVKNLRSVDICHRDTATADELLFNCAHTTRIEIGIDKPEVGLLTTSLGDNCISFCVWKEDLTRMEPSANQMLYRKILHFKLTVDGAMTLRGLIEHVMKEAK